MTTKQTHGQFAYDVAKTLYETNYKNEAYMQPLPVPSSPVPSKTSWLCTCNKRHESSVKHCFICNAYCPSLSNEIPLEKRPGHVMTPNNSPTLAPMKSPAQKKK